MANRRGSAFGTAFAIGCGIAAGVAVYQNRERIKAILEELRGGAAEPETEAPEVPAEPETDIVIDRSGESGEG